MEVIFAKFDDWRKEVYRSDFWEKPWIIAYQVKEIVQEKWNWILEHQNQKEAIEKYFPNI